MVKEQMTSVGCCGQLRTTLYRFLFLFRNIIYIMRNGVLGASGLASAFQPHPRLARS